MKKYSCLFPVLGLVILSMTGCHSSGKQQNLYDWNNGSVVITADSNLSYILEQLIPVYENFYPKASVKFQYTSEDAAISGFKRKENTIIAVERQLSADELQKAAHFQDAKVLENVFAYDAIAVITGKSFPDSVFTLEKTSSLLQAGSPVRLVFDNASSGIAKSVMQLSQTAPSDFKNAYALSTVADVLKFVESNRNAIGFIPYNLLSNRNEQEAKYIRSSFKFLAVSYKNKVTDLSQENIAGQTYPLIRPISLYVGNCPDLVGQGFANFLFSRQISKVLLLSGLVPKNIPAREVNVTNEFHPSK